MASPAQATAAAATAVADSQAAQQQQQQAAMSQGLQQPAPLKLDTFDQQTTSAPAQAATTAAVAPAAGSPTGATHMCKWSNPLCRELFPTPDDLYLHLTEVHVGRKSNNNLNLTCRWEQCNTTVIKRDHITSHLRVHVALKPHTCNKCNKSFKRPQDLKKHVKTHADDSGAGGGQGAHGGSAYAMGGQTNGFYPGQMNGGGFNFQQQSAGYHTGYTPSTHQLHTGFSTNNAYWNSQPGHSGPQATSYALNALLGAHRANEFDPSCYQTFRHRLDGFDHMGPSGYGAGMMGAGGVALAQPYQHPHELAASMSNKANLTEVADLLKKMHSAAMDYSSPQPIHTVFPEPGDLFDRASHSPPNPHHAAVAAMGYTSHSARSTTSPTPSLTPGSSVHSYTQSPAHDYALPSPVIPSVSYPSLPGSTTADLHAGLATQYEYGDRRHHAQRLGASQPSRQTVKTQSSSGDSEALDPALRALDPGSSAENNEEGSTHDSSGAATPTPASPRTSHRREEEQRLGDIALIESMLNLVVGKLESGEFDEDDDKTESGDQEMPDAVADAETEKAIKEETIKPEPEPSSTSNPIYPPLPGQD